MIDHETLPQKLMQDWRISSGLSGEDSEKISKHWDPRSDQDYLLSQKFYHSKPRKRYSLTQKHLILQKHREGQSKSLIMSSTGVPRSTLNYFIKNSNQLETLDHESVMKDGTGSALSEIQKECISKYVEPPTYPVTIGSIQNHVLEVSGSKPRKRDVKAYLNKELKMSYRKGSSLHYNAKTQENKLYQCIFSWSVLKEIYQLKYVINIDEWSYNRDVQNSYSWLPKNKNCNILNPEHSGRCSLIAGLWIDGEFFSMVVNETVNSEHIVIYMWVLREWLRVRNIDIDSEVVITMDNAKVHLSEYTSKKMSAMGYTVHYLPPYSPHLAPIETIFKYAKSKVKCLYNHKKLNF